MSDHHHNGPFPKAPLIASFVLVGAVLLLVGGYRLGGFAPEARVPTRPPVLSADLHFRDRADGGVLVYDATRSHVLEVLEPGTHGFLRVTLRTLTRERRSHGIGPEQPFRISSWENGEVEVVDPATGRRLSLRPFGIENADSFAALLRGRSGT